MFSNVLLVLSNVVFLICGYYFGTKAVAFKNEQNVQREQTFKIRRLFQGDEEAIVPDEEDKS